MVYHDILAHRNVCEAALCEYYASYTFTGWVKALTPTNTVNFVIALLLELALMFYFYEEKH